MMADYVVCAVLALVCLASLPTWIRQNRLTRRDKRTSVYHTNREKEGLR